LTIPPKWERWQPQWGRTIVLSSQVPHLRTQLSGTISPGLIHPSIMERMVAHWGREMALWAHLHIQMTWARD
jgi:hypothetical protein